MAPLYPNKGGKYNESVDEDAQSSVIENIYKITRFREDYVNPMEHGELICRRVNSYDIDSDDSMKTW
jgi:hypothetical protein